ncbi:ganglioside GM2 activator [Aplysia californica]|uniref:Ganglioside GM2 activator n=1 Tax=Aplysia californica TaxID=6500 RepID=A0ABM0JXN5_APLCA|nr:ganglioside GM2 activator [Aplysia californica]
MKFAGCTILLSVFISLCTGKQSFIIRDCENPDNAAVSLKSGSVKPYPVAIPGIVTVTGSGSVNRNLTGGGLDLQVHIERYVGFLWVTVPCISDVGSCHYDLCNKLSEAFSAKGCPAELKANNVPCTCDTLKPGTYSLNAQKFTIPELSGLYSWLASGDYKVDLKLTDRATKKQVGCVHLEGTIVDGNACEGFLCSIFG